VTERPRLEAFLEQHSPFIADDDPDLGPAVERWASHRLADPTYLRGDGSKRGRRPPRQLAEVARGPGPRGQLMGERLSAVAPSGPKPGEVQAL
jgi:hypothetical protein